MEESYLGSLVAMFNEVRAYIIYNNTTLVQLKQFLHRIAIQDVTFAHNFYVITIFPAVHAILVFIPAALPAAHYTPAPPIAHGRAISQLSIKLPPCRYYHLQYTRQTGEYLPNES